MSSVSLFEQQFMFRYKSRDDEGVISGSSELSDGVDCEKADSGPNYQASYSSYWILLLLCLGMENV